MNETIEFQILDTSFTLIVKDRTFEIMTHTNGQIIGNGQIGMGETFTGKCMRLRGSLNLKGTTIIDVARNAWCKAIGVEPVIN